MKEMADLKKLLKLLGKIDEKMVATENRYLSQLPHAMSLSEFSCFLLIDFKFLEHHAHSWCA
jgi:hypothetical protein